MTNGKVNHHNNSTFYQKNIKEQNSKTLMNQNYLKTIFVNILKKPVPVQIVSGKASKISRSDEDLEADERGILIFNEEETNKEANGLKGNRGPERRRIFTPINKGILLIKRMMLLIMRKASTMSNIIVVVKR